MSDDDGHQMLANYSEWYNLQKSTDPYHT